MAVFFTFFTLIVHLFAQSDAIPLGYGDIVHAEITPNQTDFRYTFDARAGDVVLIDMLIPINTRLEPYLQLLGPDGQRIAIFYTKLHDRLLRPLTAADTIPAPLPLRQALRTIDNHISDYIGHSRIGARR